MKFDAATLVWLAIVIIIAILIADRLEPVFAAA